MRKLFLMFFFWMLVLLIFTGIIIELFFAKHKSMSFMIGSIASLIVLGIAKRKK